MNARNVAISVLSDSRAGRRTAKQSLDDLLTCYRLAPADAGLAAELVWGVVRHRMTLESVLRSLLAEKWTRTSRTIQHILLVAAYQLLWLDGIPEFAALHEAVEQAKREGGRRAGGFVNAVLRSLQRSIVARFAEGRPDDPQRCIRTGRDRFCRFAEPILPDPMADPVRHLAVATSHPTALVDRWMERYGAERTKAICEANAMRPPNVLRPNGLRADARRLVERLAAEGCTAEAAEGAVFVKEPAGAGGVLRLGAFREGLFQPQDLTAMQPVRALDLKRGAVVIDLCAGLGTKATQAAEWMQDTGTVLAADADATKLERLRDNAARLGITCVRCVAPDDLDAAAAQLPRLDAILIDVPCSNTGVLARRPEARYRFTERGLAKLTAVQGDLLKRAVELARRDTVLCYSTCSIEPEENERMVEAFCRALPAWRIVRQQRQLPTAGDRASDWRDGGYFALLAR